MYVNTIYTHTHACFSTVNKVCVISSYQYPCVLENAILHHASQSERTGTRLPRGLHGDARSVYIEGSNGTSRRIAASLTSCVAHF